jgi:hydrogenase maturation protease
MIPLLVIGYGNQLRSDDAVGPRAAEAVASWQLPGVRAQVLPQLTPELATSIAGSGAVVFIDAAVDATAVSREKVTPGGDPIRAHSLGPAALLQLASELYGGSPPAWLVRVPVQSLELGESLSPVARRGLEQALGEIRALCRELGIVPNR